MQVDVLLPGRRDRSENAAAAPGERAEHPAHVLERMIGDLGEIRRLVRDLGLRRRHELVEEVPAELAGEGWRLIRVTAARLARPHGVLALVVQTLRAAGYPGPDPVLSDEWRRLFAPSARKLRLQHAFDSI